MEMVHRDKDRKERDPWLQSADISFSCIPIHIKIAFCLKVSDLVFEANIWIHKNSFWVNLGL